MANSANSENEEMRSECETVAQHFAEMLDQIEKRVETLRSQAQQIYRERECILTLLNSITDSQELHDLNNGTSEDISARADHLVYRCLTVDVNITVPRNEHQQQSLDALTHIIDSITQKIHPIPVHYGTKQLTTSGHQKQVQEINDKTIKLNDNQNAKSFERKEQTEEDAAKFLSSMVQPPVGSANQCPESAKVSNKMSELSVSTRPAEEARASPAPPDRRLVFEKLKSYYAACVSGDESYGPVDSKFQGLLISCTLEDQKMVRRRITSLVRAIDNMNTKP